MENQARGRSGAGRTISPGYRTDVVDVLTRLFTDRPEITRGKMFGFPAFHTGGKLFACVYGDGVGLKLPEEKIRHLEGRPGIAPFQPYGKPKMKEWIHIHRSRAQTYSKDIALFQASIAFVGRMARQSRKSSNSKPLPNRS